MTAEEQAKADADAKGAAEAQEKAKAASVAAAELARRKAETAAERRTAAPATLADLSDLETGIMDRVRKEVAPPKSAPATAAKKGGPWGIIVAIVAVLLVGGVLVFAVLRSRGG